MQPSTAELDARLASAMGNEPFPWQRRLLARLVRELPPTALDLPTGLGKTSVMAVWLVARSFGAMHLPRRLIYIVDRRAVVDQATSEAERLRTWLRDANLEDSLRLGGRRLPISTLRGQFVDNHEWLEDPSVPAIVVGTVDMIGSRLLFEGYACSRKMRPYHAGMLGHDTLFVLDEAHLVPPFEHLLDQVAGERGLRAPLTEDTARLAHPHLLALSATGRDREDAFRLDSEDRDHQVVQRRIGAIKRIAFERLDEKSKLAELLAQRAWELTESGARPGRVIVFSDKRSDAEAAKNHLESKLAHDANGKKVAVAAELFVGGRRNRERQAAASRLRDMGFLAGSKRPDAATFLFATSAGEVGVDLDADHMVCDVVAWERMVQRLGRVNRRGEGAADVIVVAHETSDHKEQNARVADLVRRLPVVSGAVESEERRSGSSVALAELRRDASDEVGHASTQPPLYPALTRPLLDAWSMTSLPQHTGRPEVQPWLRGWVDEEPQTTVVWRRLLPPPGTPAKRVRDFFEAAPPHASERLEAPTIRVRDWLLSRVKVLAATELDLAEYEPRVPDHEPMAHALDGAGERRQSWTRKDLALVTDDLSRKRLARELSGSTLVVDARLGGLTADGLLDDKGTSHEVPTIDGDGVDDVWLAAPDGNGRPAVSFRVLRRTASVERDALEASEEWFERFRLPLKTSADEEVTEWLVVEKWRHASTTEEDRAAGHPQALAEHQQWAADEARRIAEAVGLSTSLCDALCVAAALHDEGKRAERWQRAFNAPAADGPYAKTRGPVDVRLLDGYRHEFGSLPRAQADDRFKALDADQQDLVLHLIAAHHGFARPTIRITGCEDAPPSGLAMRAQEVALRFIRLQERWGPWGLAWLETVLRAADQVASRKNDDLGAGR